jgi:NTP pyrophosphatase (non-canonical NTP hydrolase)
MNLNEEAAAIHTENHKWWHDENGNPIERNKGELLCLIHSEISEAMEGERKSLMDDKLPHRPMAEVEMADTLIRILDYCAGFGYDIEGAFREKRAFNQQRTDHSREARARANGKKW